MYLPLLSDVRTSLWMSGPFPMLLTALSKITYFLFGPVHKNTTIISTTCYLCSSGPENTFKGYQNHCQQCHKFSVATVHSGFMGKDTSVSSSYSGLLVDHRKSQISQDFQRQI